MNPTFFSLSTLILAGTSLQAYPQSENLPEKPNVLFVIIDDLNDWTGPFNGHPQTKTPNFDKLAAMNAMVMLNAQSPATVCCPSRSSFLTGLRPSTTGVYGNQQNLTYSPVAAAVPTMPQYFSQNGYFSLSTGKVFHGHTLPNGTTDRGQWAFNLWETSGGSFRVDNTKIPFSGVPGDGNNDTRLDWGPTLVTKEQTGDWKSAEWAAAKIKAGFNKPFFMMLGIYRPHLSWYIPQEYFDRFDLNSIIIPLIKEDDYNDILTPGGTIKFTATTDYKNIKNYNKFKDATRAYLACVSYVDDCLGIVLDALENSKYKDNTIVVVTGDHGWFLGEKLRFGKTQLWEESCRVPLIVKTPGMTGSAKTKAVVNLVDLYPTLAELCGLPIPAHCDGRSFVPVLQNPEIPWYPSLTTNTYKSHSVRSERYRYNRWADGTEELYDHYADSMEWNNLIKDAQYATVVNELKTYLPKYDAPHSLRNDQITSAQPEKSNSSFSVSPTVFTDRIHIKTPLKNSSLEVYNIQGVRVKSIHDFKGGELDLSLLDKGSYVLNISESNETASFRIIKN